MVVIGATTCRGAFGRVPLATRHSFEFALRIAVAFIVDLVLDGACTVRASLHTCSVVVDLFLERCLVSQNELK
jgi:hypothetical protein